MSKKSEYDIEYAKKHLKRISLNVQKTEYETIKAYCDSKGETVNGLIKRLLFTEIESNKKE